MSGDFAAAESWFATTGRTAFAFQREAWQAYLAGESGLINAPTGMGKTLAAWLGPVLEARANDETRFLPAVEARREEASPSGPRLLWITPLRALASDLVENL